MTMHALGGRLVGAAALDRADEPIGEIRHVFVDDGTELPRWASVRVPLLESEVLVPLDDAAWDHEALHLAVAGATALAAPTAHGADGPTGREQERLCVHYGLPGLRFPREESAVFEVAPDEVSYSVREEDSASAA